MNMVTGIVQECKTMHSLLDKDIANCDGEQ